MSSMSSRDLDSEGIARVLRDTRTIAVLGIKPESQSYQPAFYVPEYMARAGYAIIPVPVYFPDVREILGREVCRSLRAAPGPIDMVNVFRRAEDIPPHVDDILAAKPRCVWIQLGIRNDPVAARLREAGIEVIQDRCLMVEHRRWHARERA